MRDVNITHILLARGLQQGYSLDMHKTPGTSPCSRPGKYIRNMARGAGSAVKPFARRLAADITAPAHQRAAARASLASK